MVGGGGSSGWTSGRSSHQLSGSAVSVSQRQQYEGDVNSYMQDLLSEYNNRNTDIINAHIETIRGKLESEIEGTVELRFGGSVKKHTYVEGLSDSDLLVIVSKTELSNSSPQEIREYVAQLLRERLPNTNVTVGFAITVEFADGQKIQILPALRTATGLRIPSSSSTRWSNVIKPEAFANKLTESNQASSNMVVRVIKLMKVANSQLPEDSQLHSYHIEALAVEAFQNYSGKMNYKDMLTHLAEYSSNRVLSPIKDETGQSIHVDDYLGNEGSVERQKVSKALDRTAGKMRTANSDASVEEWQDILGD